MFIINITYKVPLTEVDNHLEAHVAYLDEQYRLEHFHVSGRKEPREGGIIISLIKNKKKLEEIIDLDPFKINDLATYEIIEFTPSKTSRNFNFLVNRIV